MRVTIDIDSNRAFDVLRSWFTLRAITGKDPIGRVSSSGTGAHILVSGLPISQQTAIVIRRVCGDDYARIAFDEESRGKPLQILFDEKHGRRAGIWHSDVENLIHELCGGRYIEGN
jgi:hypothetical protein